ncbi:hypothetical protein LCGC14_2292630, partial [marine sediment metagenome]
AAVATAKAVLNDVEVPAGSAVIENEGSTLTPISTNSNARNAYQDGRMLKLQVAAATGWPEQYFGDISTGNLATAKTVELPVLKMCQSYQAVWADAYKDMNEIVLAQAKVTSDKPVDIDFPKITPHDVAEVSKALSMIIQGMPEFAEIADVKQVALMSLGIDNTAEVLDKLAELEGKTPASEVKVLKALKLMREAVVSKNGGNDG